MIPESVVIVAPLKLDDPDTSPAAFVLYVTEPFVLYSPAAPVKVGFLIVPFSGCSSLKVTSPCKSEMILVMLFFIVAGVSKPYKSLSKSDCDNAIVVIIYSWVMKENFNFPMAASG